MWEDTSGLFGRYPSSNVYGPQNTDSVVLNCSPTSRASSPVVTTPCDAPEPRHDTHRPARINVYQQRFYPDSWNKSIIVICTVTFLHWWFGGGLQSKIHSPSCDSVESLSIPHIGHLPPPVTLHGRDEVVEEVVDRIIHIDDDAKRHICLRGPPGCGTTAIATGVLYDPRIVERFGNARHWVAADKGFNATTTADHFLRYIASDLGLKLNRCSDPKEEITRFLHTQDVPRLIVLDNLETMWKPKSAIEAVEDTLLFLSQFPQLTIIVTTRNGHEPATSRGMRWHVMDPIQPLSPQAARDLFLGLTTAKETFSEKLQGTLDELLYSLDYMPQSIVLMASYGQQNYTISQILEIWQRGFLAGSQLIDYNDPMTILNNTISSFMDEPLGYSSDIATLLRVISLFPNGLDENHIQSLMPSVHNALELARTLARGSLLRRTADGRFYMYSGPRSFMFAHYSIDSLHDEPLHNYHVRLICGGIKKPGDSNYSLDNILRLQDEEKNVAACLTDGMLRNASRWSSLAQNYIDYRQQPLVASPTIRHTLANDAGHDHAS